MHPPRHSTLWTGAAATLLELFACACNANESAVDTLISDSTVQTVIHCESCLQRAHDLTASVLGAALIASDSADRPSPSPVQSNAADAGAETAPTPNPFANLRFRDQEPLVNRLQRLQAVPLVTLWDSREATVYVGMDRKGKAGLHLRQKRDDRGARAARTLIAPEDDRPTPRPPKSRRR